MVQVYIRRHLVIYSIWDPIAENVASRVTRFEHKVAKDVNQSYREARMLNHHLRCNLMCGQSQIQILTNHTERVDVKTRNPTSTQF